MITVDIEGKNYPVTVTMGVYEDLEDRGWSLAKIAEADSLSIKLVLDVLELATGVSRETLRAVKPNRLPELAKAVMAALNDYDVSEDARPGE